MHQKLIKQLSLLFAGFSLLLAFGSGWLQFFQASDFSERDIASLKKMIPVNSFEQKREAYSAIDEPVMSLRFSPPSLHLPDIRALLLYYGRNGRPDANGENPKLHFSFNGLKTITSVFAGEKNYLTYDKKSAACKYGFSPNNEETNLWFVAKAEGSGAAISLFMKNENGEVISDPDTFAAFTLAEKEFMRFAGTGAWEIGKWRVDGTLLARQKARWHGPDKFLEKHGGLEFGDSAGKQRIDFEEAEACYSVFVKAGDCLIWNTDCWEVKNPGEDSVGLPLMCVKKIDDRVMNLELWDVEGKGKVMLNLIRSQENLAAQTLTQDFRFIGARTRTQCVFQVNQMRMIVKPNDWFLQTAEGWKKLTTAQEIDDYVNRKLTGTLFVCDEIVRKDERPLLVGTMFNPTRTEMQPIEIAMQSNSDRTPHPPLKEAVPAIEPKVQTARTHYPNNFNLQDLPFAAPQTNPLVTP